MPVGEVKQLSGFLSSTSGKKWAAKLNQPASQPAPVREVDRGQSLARTETPPSPQGSRLSFVSTDDQRSPPPPMTDEGLYAFRQVDSPEGPKFVPVPIQAPGGRGGLMNYLTPTIRQYYDRENYDYLQEMKKRGTPPDQMPQEYPNGIVGWLEDVVVRFYQMVLHKRLAWVDEDRTSEGSTYG